MHCIFRVVVLEQTRIDKVGEVVSKGCVIRNVLLLVETQAQGLTLVGVLRLPQTTCLHVQKA